MQGPFEVTARLRVLSSRSCESQVREFLCAQREREGKVEQQPWGRGKRASGVQIRSDS